MSWYTKMTDTGNSFIVQTKRRSLRVLGAPDVIDGSTASEFRALGASTSSPAFRAKITGTTNGHGPNTGASISQRRCAQRFLASILRLTFIFDGLRRALPPYPPEVAESLGRRVSIPSRPPSAIGGLNNCKAMRRTTGTSLTVNSSSVFAIAVRIGFPGSASLVDLGFSKTGSTKRGNHELLSFTENRFYVIGSSQPVFHLDCASPFVFPQAIDAHCVGMLQRDSPDSPIGNLPIGLSAELRFAAAVYLNQLSMRSIETVR